ncbi:specifically androgen-regulated gene protein-like [Dunckerocampus dactyliophorus]|uniref:specifically androgen-regulated gene protein-like n=1 Tax=Dunckerocampus dactyliophorus TaxID=161453 RepID=UPI002405EFD8|nr:specifically androgen-regulated gene protein-like [Dunckerocampus dactyliophorus]
MNHPHPLACAMQKGDTWHGGAAMGSLNNMESAGSYDSVISVNSGCSEDSLEHLSAEERACLMFLEQTIEALEVQEDSGLSNDEPDSGHLAKKMALNEVTDVSGLNFESGMNHSRETLPLLLVDLPAEEECRTLTEENLAEHLLNHTYEPDVSSDASTETREASVNTTPELQLLAADSLTISPDTKGLCLPPIDDSLNTLACTTPEIDLDLIPPPSDFMDDPRFVPEPNIVSVKAPPVTSSSRPVSVDLNQLYQRALEKRAPASSPNKQNPPEKLPIEATLNSPALAFAPPVVLLPEGTELRRTSSLATKPKSLSNIVLTPHNTPEPESNSPTGNSNHERVHLEALRKLGLLKGDVKGLSPKTRKSWADPSSPSSPADLSPAKLTPSYTSISTPHLASDVLLSPTTFSDTARPLSLYHEQSPVKHVLKSPPDAVKLRSPPRTPSDLVKQLTKATGAQPGVQAQADSRIDRPVSYHEGISVEQCLSHATRHDFRRRRSTHTNLQHSGDSHKVPRSQGVSVMICPRDENGVGRRDALKKLGLIRD